jgi:hypothetical protein
MPGGSQPGSQTHPRQVTSAGSVVTWSRDGISSNVRPQHGISGLSGDGLRCVTPSCLVLSWRCLRPRINDSGSAPGETPGAITSAPRTTLSSRAPPGSQRLRLAWDPMLGSYGRAREMPRVLHRSTSHGHMDLIFSHALTGMAKQTHVHRGHQSRVNRPRTYQPALCTSRAFMTKLLISRRSILAALCKRPRRRSRLC